VVLVVGGFEQRLETESEPEEERKQDPAGVCRRESRGS
jgi:hypothetical protein